MCHWSWACFYELRINYCLILWLVIWKKFLVIWFSKNIKSFASKFFWKLILLCFQFCAVLKLLFDRSSSVFNMVSFYLVRIFLTFQKTKCCSQFKLYLRYSTWWNTGQCFWYLIICNMDTQYIIRLLYKYTYNHLKTISKKIRSIQLNVKYLFHWYCTMILALAY